MEELTALIALSRVWGIRDDAKKLLVESHEQAAVLFTGKVKGLSREASDALRSFKAFREIDEEIKQLGKMGVEVITIKDSAYPSLLKMIPDPPVVIFKKGPLSFSGPSLAVVGARKATYEGMLLAERISETLSSLGVTVVSGLARGIDASAHQGALRHNGGTIGILGCGIDIVYPSENKRLYEEIAEKGAIVTEYGLGDPPIPRHFPERNRIIAGLAKGVLVVEASTRSGSLITARLGLEYGREVMAIPGRVFDEAHKGANNLIKQGARLVEDLSDILNTSFPDLKAPKKTGVELDNDEAYIYSLLSADRVHVDELIEKSRVETKKVMAVLTRLEMKDMVKPVPGGFYIRKV